jgi:hypothetical protein
MLVRELTERRLALREFRAFGKKVLRGRG